MTPAMRREIETALATLDAMLLHDAKVPQTDTVGWFLRAGPSKVVGWLRALLADHEADMEQAFREGFKDGCETTMARNWTHTPDKAVAAWRERRAAGGTA